MKVTELLMNIKNKEFKLERALEVKKYLPIMDKKKLAIDVIAECTNDTGGFIAVDRFKMNIYFDMCVLSTYTNLEIETNFDQMIEQYDMLCESETMGTIIDLFDNDYNALCVVVEDMLDEILTHNSIDCQVAKVASTANTMLSDLGEKFSRFNISNLMSGNVDVTQLLDIVKLLK